MPDLVEKYFGADLTQAEQESLGGLLLSSDEAALKFEALAKEAYTRYGLPEPQPRWPDGPGPTLSARSGFNPWIWGTVLVVGLLSVFFGWDRLKPIAPKLVSMGNSLWAKVSSSSPEAEAPSSSKPVGKPRRPSAVKSSVTDVETAIGKKDPMVDPAEISGASSGAQGKPGGSPAASWETGPAQKIKPSLQVAQGAVTPKAIEENSSSHSNLSVEVEQASLGQVTVRVVDPRGLESVLLYHGNLAPGNWAFEWDGKLAPGRPASPGYYQIEVKSGSFVQKKTIQIQ